MALQVWLPLNGNIKNLGLSNIATSTIETVAYDNLGKIGKCFISGGSSLTLNGINLNNNLVNILNNSNGSSVSVWIKPVGNHVHYNGTIISSGNWNGTTWTFGVSLDNSLVDVLCKGYNQYISCSVPVNEWTHLVGVYKDGVSKVYKNGVYIGLKTGLPVFASDASNTCVGRETYASGYFGFNGRINDLRVYDHALSEEEIHELSLGKVGHWCLDENSLDGQNLITGLLGGGQCTISGNTVNISGTNSDTYFYLKTSAAMESGKLYKISCTGSGFPSSAIYNFPIAGLNNTGPGQIKIKNGYCSMIFIANDTCANVGTTIIMDDTSRSAGAGTISNLRLVKLNKSCDISGNHYDLTVNGNPTLSNDSARYNKSTLFNGSNYLSCTSPTAEAKTVSLWAYVGSALPSANLVLFADYKSKLAIGFHPSLHGMLCRSVDNEELEFSDSLVLLNSWNHFCLVNGDTKQLYINGNTANKISYSSTWTHQSDVLMIGNRSYNNGTGYLNKISDVSLYAAALSADDVLKLYKLGNV